MQAGKGSVELRRYPKSHPFAQLQVGSWWGGLWPLALPALPLASTPYFIDYTTSCSCCLPILAAICAPPFACMHALCIPLPRL